LITIYSKGHIMTSHQTQQEKKAWHTPEIVVLTTGTDMEPSVLRVCKINQIAAGPRHENSICGEKIGSCLAACYTKWDR